MALTLDAIHAAAQITESRHPLCQILSLENVAAIPFNGEFLSTSSVNEQHPEAKMHSTGRMFVAFAYGPSGTTYTIRYGYTDVGRTYFTYVDLDVTSGSVVGEVSVCEMADAYIGIIWEETNGGTRYIKYRKITVTGVDASPAVTGTVFSQASSAFFTGPTVTKLADNSYIMVYGIQDGDSHYHLYRRTSADFVTWSAASEISLSGLTDTLRKANPSFLIETNSGDLWLLFDYLASVGPSGEELTNVYYVSSNDKLATPSVPAALTTYTSYADKAEHPVAVQKSTGDIYLAFTRLLASLKMDVNSTGWCGTASPIANMHIDVAAQKLYVVSSLMGAGNKTLYCVVKIDLATWTIDKCWSTSSVPAFPTYFENTSGTWWDSYRGDGHYVPVGHQNGMVSVLDAQADTITNYAFYDFSAFGIAQNVTWTPPAMSFVTNMSVAKIQIDAATSRMYVLLVRPYVYQTVYMLGYFDLTDPGPTYTFTTVLTSTGSGYDEEWFATGLRGLGMGWMEVNPAADLVILSGTGVDTGLHIEGKLRIYSLSTGGLWKDYTTTTNPTFPKLGLRRGAYNDGLIVGDFQYIALYGQQDYRGLCIIDTATDIITYNRPPWASVNDYELKDIAIAETGEYLIAAGSYGVTLFDGTTWTLFSNTSVPGLTTSGYNEFYNPIVYNPTTEMILAGSGINYGGHEQGLIMFSRSGYIKQSNYRIGTLSGSWSWGTAAALVQGYTDYEASLTVDPDDDGLYAFWTNKNGSELSTKWDKEMPAFDLSSYLVRGAAVERSSTIDPVDGNWDASLSFSVTHGHLFDSSNSSSLLRQYLAKGRRLSVQFGDKILGAEYWETLRYFTVSDDGELTYERPEYPVMQVEAETPRRRWEQIHIANSGYSSTTPEEMIKALILAYDTSKTAAMISLGTWPNSATISFQAVDISLADAVNQISIHFGYVIRDGANGLIEAVKISTANAVNRSYSDNTKMVRISPKNKNSSFTNRWIVECEEATFIELLMKEELAAEFAASHRWNTGSKTYRINYTQGDKIYRNPRLEVVQSVKSLAFDLAGSCSETLVDNSHDEADQTLWDTYCEIDIDSPDLTPAFIAALAGLVSSYFLPDWLNLFTETTVRVGSYYTGFWIFVCLNILAATGNFQYRIYGQPVVKSRRTVSATANDTAAQTKMGQIVPEQAFQDSLCKSAADCQLVADFRKMVGMGERSRWSSEMIADLRAEEGDTISVIHPISGDGVTAFLTDLKTTYLMPESEGGEGGLYQEFEGWRV